MIPRWREFPALLWLGVTHPAWRDRPPRIRTRLFTTLDHAAGWLERHDPLHGGSVHLAPARSVVTMTVPDEAITAAAALLQQSLDPHAHEVGAAPDRDVVSCARDVLEAAAPLIAAAERDRIRQLAEDTWATYPAAGAGHEPFADLLRGDQPTCPRCPEGARLLLNGGPHCPNCGWRGDQP